MSVKRVISIKRNKENSNLWPAEAYLMLTAATFLVGIGLTMVLSASFVYAIANEGTPIYYKLKQLGYLVAGILLASIVYLIAKYTDIKKFAALAWWGSIFLLVLTFVPGIGVEIAGARRWIDFGVFRFQPSEVCKFTVILYVATILSSLEKQKLELTLKDIIPALSVMGFTSLLVLLQPDWTTAALISFGGLMVILFSRLPLRKYLVLLAGSVFVAFLAAIIEPYRVRRLLTFLDPWKDPRGEGYQIIHALFALALGGLSGTGIGASRQKFLYLPAPHTDFILAVIGEELGFIGVFAIIVFFGLFYISGVRLAFKVCDDYGRRIVLSAVTLITFQALVNMGANTGLFPVMGVTLPFVSYGGTSLIITLSALGLILGLVAKGSVYENSLYRRRYSRSRLPGIQRDRVIKI